MEDICSVVLAGRLTKDPETRNFPSGGSICTLRLAWTQSKKVNGEYQDVPGFIEATVFGTQGEMCQRYLSKGRQVIVKGRLDFSEWETDGNKRSAIRINAERVQFIGTGQQSNDAPQQQTAPQVAQETAPF